MKRLLSLLLVIAMLFGICTIFTACDSSSGVSDKDDDDDDKKKDDDEDEDEDDDVEPTLVLKGLKIVLPEDFELESQDESEGDNSAQAFFEGDSYSVAVSCGPLSGDMEGMSAKELRDYILEQLDPEDEDAGVGEYDTGSKNKTPYFYAVKDDETMAIVGAFYADGEYAWQVRVMTNEDSEDFSVEEMIDLVTGWKYEAPKAEDEDEDNWDEDNEDDRDEDDEHPEQNTTQPTEGTTPEPSEPEEPEEQIGNFQLPAEGYDGTPVTITFYHTMGAKQQEVLDWYINEFNKLYPNITVVHQQIGTYSDVHDQIKVEITAGNQPNIAYCYPDHVGLYNIAQAVVTMDSFMFSEIPVYRADGSVERLGLTDAQFDDFYPGFMEGTRVYGDGMAYTLPMSKSTEVLYYNKTFFDANGLAVPTTWDEVESVCWLIKQIDPNSIPLGIDSESNLFINYAMQRGSGYIGADGSVQFDRSENRDFMQRLRGWYEAGLITTMGIHGSYTSGLLASQSSYMSIGSSAGARYNTGNYELGVAMIPQATSQPWVISQGPELCIFQQEDPQEVVASWLFVKFLTTNADFQAEFSMSNGYMPVIKSAVEHPAYQAFLDSADGYNNVTALVLNKSMAFIEYCSTTTATHRSAHIRDIVGLLVQQCMTAPMQDVTSGIQKAFNDAEAEIEYYG